GAAVGGREEQLPVVFDREIILVAAVVGIGVGRRSAAEARCRDSPLALRGDGAGQGVGGLPRRRLIDGPAGGAQVNVFLIRLPGDAGGLEQGAEVGRVIPCRGDQLDVVIEVRVGVAVVGVGVVVVGHAEVATAFLPDVVRLRRVDAYRWVVVQHVVVIAGVGGLCGVGIAGGHEAVQIGGCGIAKELLWRPGGYVRWLREVVVLHVNVKDIANGRVER